MKILLKILLAPVTMLVSLFIWLCAGLISCSAFVFKIASALLSILAVAVMITYSVKNGAILLVLAFLISPMGLPMLAVWILGKLQGVNAAMKNFIHG
ncbi:MAG: CD1845 family protein [Faecousia sp.]